MGAAAEAETPKPIALRLDRLTKRFGSVVAVDDVSLEIKRGEFLTLLGPSGSGKSTTLHLIAGFESPNAGDIYLENASLLRVPPQRRRIGIVFQNYALFPHLTVFENIAFGPRTAHWTDAEIRKRVNELLELVHLEGHGGRLPAELSGGQQQRVALARALAPHPTVLLLDEPLGALDRKLREQMLAEFRRIHRLMKTTMIYITHDQEEALVMSDRIAVMNHGHVVQIGAPRELYQTPRDAFVANFLGVSNLLLGTALPGGKVSVDGWEVAVPHGNAPGEPVRFLVRPERIVIGAHPGWNSASGEIEDVSYLGEALIYQVRTEHDQKILVKELSRRHGVEYEIGDSVSIAWHPDDGSVVMD